MLRALSDSQPNLPIPTTRQGLQVFVFCVVNITDEHIKLKFKKKFRDQIQRQLMRQVLFKALV